MADRTKFRCRLSPIVLGVLAVGGLLLGAQPASAQTCIQDVWKAHGNNQNLTCTANDVTLSEATNINIISGGDCTEGVCRCFAGGTVTFTADFRMDLTADTRYDIGFYIATDQDPNNDGAKTGLCEANASLASNTPAGNFINLDAAPDVCGDITGPLNTAHNPIFVSAQISAECPAGAGEQLAAALLYDLAAAGVEPGVPGYRQRDDDQRCLSRGAVEVQLRYPGPRHLQRARDSHGHQDRVDHQRPRDGWPRDLQRHSTERRDHAAPDADQLD